MPSEEIRLHVYVFSYVEYAHLTFQDICLWMQIVLLVRASEGMSTHNYKLTPLSNAMARNSGSLRSNP